MTTLSLILRVAAVVAAALSFGLYITSQGKLAEMDARQKEAATAAESAQQMLSNQVEQLATLQQELSTERASAADAQLALEGLRAEIYTARREITQSKQELKEARESVQFLEDSGRRLRQDLIKTEQVFTDPAPDQKIEELSARIIELENENLDLTRQLHAATQKSGRVAENNSALLESPNHAIVDSVLVQAKRITLRTHPQLAFQKGEILNLSKDGEFLARIHLLKIDSGLAIANLLPESKISRLSQKTRVELSR